jgi:pyruvate dehydrogenase E2 component (dihydrolipoamide acetyltransferase)
MFGVESFIAVINPPEAAILVLGAIQPQPAFVEDRLVVRSLMTATLSVDHCVADGVTAARFLGELRQFLENPAMLLPTKEMHP